MALIRKYVAIYFLLMAIPCSLIALWGDLVAYSEAAGETDWTAISDAVGLHPELLPCFVFMNMGFLLLIGYVRFCFSHKPVDKLLSQTFWTLSALYNLTLLIAEMLMVVVEPRGSLLAMLVAIPSIGLISSLACLDA